MIVHDRGSRIEISGMPVDVERAVKSRLTLPNPRYVGAVKAGKVPIGIEPDLRFWQGSEAVSVPGGFLAELQGIASHFGEPLELRREGFTVAPLAGSVHFSGRLRMYQMLALAEFGVLDCGVLCTPTGSGKTVMGIARICDIRQPTLVTVHTQKLQAQWVERLWEFIGGIGTGAIGAVGGGGFGPGHVVTVGIINTLAKYTDSDPFWQRFGHILVDECHRVASPSYQAVLGRCRAKYRTGLSATPWRSDGLDAVIGYTLGPMVSLPRAELEASGAVLPAHAEQIPTGFTSELDASENYQAVITQLVHDSARNELIAEQVQAASGVQPLILTDRVEHAEILADKVPGAVCLHGKQRKAERQAAEAELPTPIVATVQLLGEGFDLPAADVLAIATPIKFDGRLIQAIGRVLRPVEGKTEGLVLDFCDWQVPQLAASARARAKTYAKMKRGDL